MGAGGVAFNLIEALLQPRAGWVDLFDLNHRVAIAARTPAQQFIIAGSHRIGGRIGAYLKQKGEQ
jgi:hypothetical protein